MINVQATDDGREAGGASSPIQLSSSNLGAFLEISPDALVLINQAGSIVMVNQQAEALFGYPRSQLLDQPLEQLLPERFRDAHREHRARYFSAPRTRPMETGLPLFGLRQDGTEFPLDISLRPLLIDEALCVIAAVRDMSKQQAMDMELAKRLHDERQLHMLNTILSASAEYIYLIDKQGRWWFASEKGAAVHGLKQSDFDGKTWQELGLSAEYIASFEVNLRKALATGRTVTEEILYPVVTGLRWFEYVTNPIVDEHGEVESVVVASKDITERKQAEAAQYRLVSIVESSGDAIFSKTLEGVITSWNSSAEALFGYPAEEIIGQSVLLLLPPDHQQELGDNLAQIARGKTIKNRETTRVRKDGTHIPVWVTISPILDQQGRIIGASSLDRDMSEQKRAENALRQSRDELVAVNAALEQANLVRNQFLSTMSHELRTPLAAIVGFSEMLLDDAKEAGWDQQQQSNLEHILRNGEHLLDLINDVLDLSKIEAGRMLLDYRQVDVADLLSEVASEIGSLAIVRHLFLRTEVEEGIGCLETNPVKLHQILQNLVSNAIKFTEQGGVTLSASRVVLPDRQTEGMAFAVQDSGIGIPADIQAHIFEAFYQADMSYTRKVGGTGLGLAIVSQLTALLGGTISVASAAGQGSTFTLTLPVKAAHGFMEQGLLPRLHPGQPENVLTRAPASSALPIPEVFEVPGQPAAAAGHHDLILVVDDNPETIVVIERAMRDTPYTIIGVQDPLTVMGLVRELHPSAITLDVMMPQLNGWQLLHQLKDNPATASIPVVMVTVLSEQATGYVLGADDYVIKPFKKEVLCDTLTRLIEAKRGSISSEQA
jgi:PAS domain S-box-containing protein